VPGPPLLDLQGLTVSYRARPVLRNLSLTVNRGEQWAVLGPNGAGKTTLARVLAGELPHYSGHCRTGLRVEQSGVAFVCFERARALLERDRRRDVSEFSADARDAGTQVADLLAAVPEADTWISRLGLRPLLARGLRYLSTGEMRKTLLASAILQRPGLLFIPERILQQLEGLRSGVHPRQRCGDQATTHLLVQRPPLRP
jgi:molybdate transport system ATP-binding protein